MNEADLTREITLQALVFLAATCVVIPACRKARVSAVLGFLAIGIAMGPHVLGVAASGLPWLAPFTLVEHGATRVLAELGVVFLLFVIGLELSLERLWHMRRLVFGLGLAQLLLTAAAIALVVLASGGSTASAVVFGLAGALSSTALVLQLLRERREISTPAGRASFAVLLLQDVMVVPILFVVAALGTVDGSFAAGNIGLALLSSVAAMVAIYASGRLLLRPLFRWVAAIDSREVFMAAAFLAAIGMAAAAHALGLSSALGALLAGLLLAETEFRHQIEADLGPFKDLLLGLFFVTVGMQVDLPLLFAAPLQVLGVVLALMLGKALLLVPLVRAFGLSWRRAVEVGVLLGQAGEFGFVVVAAARVDGAVPAHLADLALLVIALSILATPLLVRLAAWMLARVADTEAPALPVDDGERRGHVVIAGFGRVGQTLADILEAQDIEYVAVDADAALVADQRTAQSTAQSTGRRPIHFGDASRVDVLGAVGATRAAAIVVTMDDAAAVDRIVAAARGAWPGVQVFARARDGAHARRLHSAGAAYASPDTIEATLQLGGAVLDGIGVPDELAWQIIDDCRQRERAKALGLRTRDGGTGVRR